MSTLVGEKLAPKNENSGQISLIAGTLILRGNGNPQVSLIFGIFLIIIKSKNSNDYSKVTEDNK